MPRRVRTQTQAATWQLFISAVLFWREWQRPPLVHHLSHTHQWICVATGCISGINFRQKQVDNNTQVCSSRLWLQLLRKCRYNSRYSLMPVHVENCTCTGPSMCKKRAHAAPVLPDGQLHLLKGICKLFSRFAHSIQVETQFDQRSLMFASSHIINPGPSREAGIFTLENRGVDQQHFCA